MTHRAVDGKSRPDSRSGIRNCLWTEPPMFVKARAGECLLLTAAATAAAAAAAEAAAIAAVCHGTAPFYGRGADDD